MLGKASSSQQHGHTDRARATAPGTWPHLGWGFGESSHRGPHQHMCSSGSTWQPDRSQDACHRGPEDTVPQDLAWAWGFFYYGSLLSFLCYKLQVTHCLMGKTPLIPKDGLWGPMQSDPKFCCRYPPLRPALVPSQPLSAPPQMKHFPSFKTLALLWRPAQRLQHPAPPAHGGNSQSRAQTLWAFLGMPTSALHTLSSRLSCAYFSSSPLGLESSIYQLSWLYHELLLQGTDCLLPTCVTHQRQSRRLAYRVDVLTEGPGLGTIQVAPEIT